eukprot:2732682-Amphidinium_carterae.3
MPMRQWAVPPPALLPPQPPFMPVPMLGTTTTMTTTGPCALKKEQWSTHILEFYPLLSCNILVCVCVLAQGYAPLPPAHMLAAGPAPGYPYGVPGGRPPALTWGP